MSNAVVEAIGSRTPSAVRRCAPRRRETLRVRPPDHTCSDPATAAVAGPRADPRAGVLLGALLCGVQAAVLLGATSLRARAGEAAAPAPTHRSLRDNVPQDVVPEPTEPRSFTGYPQAPPFTVVPQISQLTFFPCTNCHAAMQPNPQPRKLNTPHPAALVHGNGRFWCLDCHTLKDRDHLHTLLGQPVSYDESYLVCGQCHFNRQKDWYFGAHGKRVANWQGPRLIYSCTHCHDPHDPTIKPRAPQAPPPVRAGLQRMPKVGGGGPEP